MVWLYIILGIIGYLYMGRVTNKYLIPYIAIEGTPASYGETEAVVLTMIFWPFVIIIFILMCLGKLLMLIGGTPKTKR